MLVRAQCVWLLTRLWHSTLGVVIRNVFVVNHVDAIILGIASRVRAFSSQLAVIWSITRVFNSRRQIVTDSWQGCFTNIATLRIGCLFNQLRVVFAGYHSSSISGSCLRGNLFRKFCLINSGLLLLFLGLVLSDIDEGPLYHFFYWLSWCFLQSIICLYYKFLWSSGKCL